MGRFRQKTDGSGLESVSQMLKGFKKCRLSEGNTVLVKSTLKSFEGFFFTTSKGKP